MTFATLISTAAVNASPVQRLGGRPTLAFRAFSASVLRPGRKHTGNAIVMSSKKDEHKEEVEHLKEELKKGGLTKEVAEQVLAAWTKDAGHELSPEDLRKVLIKSSTRFTGYLLVQMLLDAGAAWGAFFTGNLLDDGIPEYGLPAIILSAIAYILAGYYATGVIFDFAKLGALLVAFYQFNVNSATFLEAVQELAVSSGSTGLSTIDKARDAVNMYKVLQALLRASDLLNESQASSGGSSPDMLRDLGAYLTLEKAQRSFGFDAAKMGLTDAKALEIAVVFSKYDKNDDGVLSLDEFKRLCAEFAPELSEPEVQAGFKLIDTNGDQQIEFKEFVAWWCKKLQLPEGTQRDGSAEAAAS